VLFGYLSAETNSYRDPEVRRALAPLIMAAQEFGAAVVAVRHFTKAPGGTAITRGGGSIAFVAAARSQLVWGRDPEAADDKQGGILARGKCNLAKTPASLAYHIEEAKPDRPRVVWDGTSTHSADALAGPLPMDAEAPLAASAEDVIRQLLADGPVPAEEGETARKAHGFSAGTWAKAKAAVGVCSRKLGGRGAGWEWYIATDETPKAQNGAKDSKSHPSTDTETLNLWPDSGAEPLPSRRGAGPSVAPNSTMGNVASTPNGAAGHAAGANSSPAPLSPDGSEPEISAEWLDAP
jgi:hypothetical protein